MEGVSVCLPDQYKVLVLKFPTSEVFSFEISQLQAGKRKTLRDFFQCLKLQGSAFFKNSFRDENIQQVLLNCTISVNFGIKLKVQYSLGIFKVCAFFSKEVLLLFSFACVVLAVFCLHHFHILRAL